MLILFRKILIAYLKISCQFFDLGITSIPVLKGNVKDNKKALPYTELDLQLFIAYPKHPSKTISRIKPCSQSIHFDSLNGLLCAVKIPKIFYIRRIYAV